MRQDRTKSDSFHRWDNLVTAVAANATDLSHLETSRQKLDTMLTEVRDLTARQAVLSASKQDVSKRITELVRSGRKVAAFIQAGIREHYGAEAEKLTEFRLQPFRGRKVKEQLKPAIEPKP
jgi:outer membrane murein-binding lipoprotein Lpp